MMTPTQDPLFIAFRTFVLALFPSDVEVVQGQDNFVSEPKGKFVVMTPHAQRRLSTNWESYTVDEQRVVTQPTEYNIQVDCYGADASDIATTLSAMWRDQFGCDVLDESTGGQAAPLYSTDPIQIPLINAEKNYEQRFTFNALIQFNPAITVPQQSATDLALELVNVDAEFPPD